MILLGSTGSIGVNTLIIAERFNITVEALVAGRNITLLNEQIQKFQPKFVVIADTDNKEAVNHPDVRVGSEAILELIEQSESSLVVNALVGFLGFAPTLKAIECGKKIALANKESLVAGGSFVDTSNIQPIDSEHFGLWYLLQDRPLSKMTITASGGAFRDWDIAKLKTATLADTQKHPNWSMGQKITIDSATMVNKMFELLEARWLFGEGEYDAIIETQSIIHALIDFKDGSTTAHFAHANMQLPIAYAIDQKMEAEILKPVDLVALGALEFKPITTDRYPVWELKEDILKNPHKGLIVNAANEAAIEKFVKGQCSYLDISASILDAYAHFDRQAACVDEVFAIDEEVRRYVQGV